MKETCSEASAGGAIFPWNPYPLLCFALLKLLGKGSAVGSSPSDHAAPELCTLPGQLHLSLGALSTAHSTTPSQTLIRKVPGTPASLHVPGLRLQHRTLGY